MTHRSAYLIILFWVISFAAISQPSTNIWLFSLENGQINGDPLKVTNREGYDNQPNFGGDILYYTTAEEDQTEVYGYNTKTKEIIHITDTYESEYSPTPTPDRNHVSVIMVEKDSTQRLWSYHLIKRERKVVLIDLKPVGYHVWFGNYDLGVFVLGETNDLYIANSFNGQSEKVISDIGRSLNNIPGQFGKFSFIKNKENEVKSIMVTDGVNHSELINLPMGTQDFNWLNDSTVVTGVGPKLLKATISGTDWSDWADLSGLNVKEISRIAINDDATLIAVVVQE